jgi:SnoaL-like domain
MHEAIAIANAYLDTWNQRAAPQRQALLARHWNADARYVDPLMAGQGTAQIGGLIAAVHERFPRFRFALLGKPDGHGDYVRLSWSLGPDDGDAPIEGSDVVRLRDGKIDEVVGFIDRAPLP